MNEAQPAVEVCLALGANLGSRLAALRTACTALAPFVEITSKSAVYETAAAYVTDQPAFLNAAVRGVTRLRPQELLYTVKNIEVEMGRLPSFRYGPRAIDIDIIFYGQETVQQPDLLIPHALMAERMFVLAPLNDVAATWVHPVLNQTTAELLATLSQNEALPQRWVAGL